MIDKRQEQLIKLLNEKRLVKVISGIGNFNPERVEQVVRAATLAGAGAVDVAARCDIVLLARRITNLPIFASSVSPEELAIAVACGADAVEIGNFDTLYKSGFYLTSEELLALTEKTLTLIPLQTLLSVTIPGHLSVEAQIRLAKRLEAMEVSMIQTEGISRVVSMARKVKPLSADEKALLSLENTRALCQVLSIPVMTASGINTGNVKKAFLAGASAVGIGSAVNQLSGEEEMTETVKLIINQLYTLPLKEAATLAS